MNKLSVLMAWPFLLLAFGLVFVTLNDIFPGSGAVLLVLAMIAIFLMWLVSPHKPSHMDEVEQLNELRMALVTMTLGTLVPIFVRYMFDAFDHILPIIILGLVLGFGLTIWAMFVKGNRTIMYANVIGGALTIGYVYTQLWQLGGAARVIAAAFGLLVAVVISTIKLRDKLT